MSRGQSHRRTDSRRKALERCKAKGKSNNVIDIDGDKNPDFIIIDPPEPSEQTFPNARMPGKDKITVQENVICIDDDENSDCGCFQNGVEQNGNQDVHCDHGRKDFSKSSNGWAACSWDNPSSSWQNFGPSTSYENDDSDCDIVEDHLGNIRRQWEEASMKKKKTENVLKSRSGFQDEVGSTRFPTNPLCNVDVTETTKASGSNIDVNKTSKAPTPSSSGNANCEKGNLGPSACTDEDVMSTFSNKLDGEIQSVDLEESIKQGMYPKTSVINYQVPDSKRLNLPILVSDGVGTSDVQNCIIGSREMLKKTDAYKRAEEAEWASRQRELQIQAEEARRLRKRRKAETLRLLEMERRQKQRVDEVREAHKKDEETLNLKDQLRVEVRKELDHLEANCKDMASLLRGLGISIGSSLCPLPSEVRAAYKQALLKFHPDRASRCGIREQIEAEEKFKLISRAKERFKL